MNGWLATPDDPTPCSCGDELAHCHGVLVVHVTGSLECDEHGCSGDLDVHVWQVGCDEVEGGCGCDPIAAGAPVQPFEDARAA